MRTFKTLLCCTLIAPASTALGQAYGELTINDVRARFHAHGLIGHNLGSSTAAFEVPQGEGAHALYSAGLWAAGVTSDQTLHLSAMKYEANGQGDYYTGPLTTDGTASTDAAMMEAYDEVWEATSEQVERHLAYFTCLGDPGCDVSVEFPDGYEIPPGFFEWPAINSTPGFATYQAPFYDFNLDGDYDPAAGDAPCILGDQALYFVFNDKGGPHLLSGSQPIGLEIQAMAFAYESGDPFLDQTVFVHYHIINRGILTLNETRIGLFNDFDLGCGDDDFVGTDAARNLTYVYNGDAQDDDCGGITGYGPQPPAFGMAVLKGPYLDYDLADNAVSDALPSWNGTAFADGVFDNEKHGLSKAIHMYRDGDPCCTDPSLSVHYQNYLRGVWKDGVPLTYGGTGHTLDPGALNCSFAFPGSSDPVGAGTGGAPQAAWSEAGFTAPDRRTVSSLGPFTLEPGMHEDLLLAYVFARTSTGGAAASVAALQARVDSVRAFANTLPLWTNLREEFQGGCENLGPNGTEELSTAALRLFPVPASDAVQLDVPDQLVGATLRIYDPAGRIVATHRLAAGLNTIGIASLAQGVYACEVRSEKARYTGRLVKE